MCKRVNMTVFGRRTQPVCICINANLYLYLYVYLYLYLYLYDDVQPDGQLMMCNVNEWCIVRELQYTALKIASLNDICLYCYVSVFVFAFVYLYLYLC